MLVVFPFAVPVKRGRDGRTFSLARKHPCQNFRKLFELDDNLTSSVEFEGVSAHDASPTITTALASCARLNCALFSVGELWSMSERSVRCAGHQAAGFRPPRITRSAGSSQQGERWAGETAWC
jgi:hypothetical protein